MNGLNDGTMSQPRPINVMLVPNFNGIDGYNVNAGSSVLFLDEQMTELRLRSRDMNGFPMPERIWKMKEVTPPPKTGPGANYVTHAEFEKVTTSLDEITKILKTLTE